GEGGGGGVPRGNRRGRGGRLGFGPPERAGGRAVRPASDWYSAGVMLFEALTNRLPFVGPPLRVLQDKQTADAPDPRSLVAGLPDDLAGLCVALLAREPEKRPTGADVRRLVGERSCSLTPPPVPEVKLVGRREHLAQLRDASNRTREGRAVVVAVEGVSGSGKSALLRSFLDELAGQSEIDPVVLAGRCYEQE